MPREMSIAEIQAMAARDVPQAPRPARRELSVEDIRALSASQPEAEPEAPDFNPLRQFAQGASYGTSDELKGLFDAVVASGTRGMTGYFQTPPGRALLRARFPHLANAPDTVLDEMVTRTTGESLQETLGVKPEEGFRDVYRRSRNEERALLKQGMEASPVGSVASGVAGGIMGPGPRAAKTRGGLVAQGAGLAAAGGAGTSEAEDLVGVLKSAAMAAPAGAVLNPAFAALGNRLTRALQRHGQESAGRAIMGSRSNISSKMAGEGFDNPEEARAFFQKAYDMGLIRPGRTAEDVLRQSQELKPIYGAMMEDAVKQADDAAAAGAPAYDPMRSASEAYSSLVGPRGALDPTAFRKTGEAQQLVADVLKSEAMPGKPTFADALKQKQSMYEGINYATEPTLATKAQQRVASGLRKSMEAQLRTTAGDEAADQLRLANERYSVLAPAADLAREEAGRQLERQRIGMSDVALALLGAEAGSNLAGPGGASMGALPLATKLLGPRIPSTMAGLELGLLHPLQSRVGPKASVGTASYLSPRVLALIEALRQKETP